MDGNEDLNVFEVGLTPLVKVTTAEEEEHIHQTFYKVIEEYNTNPVLRSNLKTYLDVDLSKIHFKYSEGDQFVTLTMSFKNVNEKIKLNERVQDNSLAHYLTDFLDNTGLSIDLELGFDEKVEILVVAIQSSSSSSSLQHGPSLPKEKQKDMNKDLDQSCQMNLIPQEISQQNMKMSTVLVRLYVPLDANVIKEVCLVWNNQCFPTKNINNTNIWTVQFQASIRNSFFQIEIGYRKQSRIPLVFGDTEKLLESNIIRNLREESTYFIVFPASDKDKSLLEKALISFCTHILSSEANLDRKQAFSEIDALTRTKSISYEKDTIEVNFDCIRSHKTQEVVHDIIYYTQNEINNDNVALFTYIFGRILAAYGRQLSIDASLETLIRSIVKQTCLLPEKGETKDDEYHKDKIGRTFKSMYGIAMGKKANAVGFIGKTLHYLSEDYLSEIINQSVSQQMESWSLYIEEDYSCHLSQILLDMLKANKIRLLQNVLRHLPNYCRLSDFISTANILLTNSTNSSSTYEKLSDLLLQRCVHCLTQATKSGDLKNLLSSWQKVKELPDAMKDILSSHLEKGIIFCIEKEGKSLCFDKVNTELMQLAVNEEIFKTYETKRLFLQKLVDSKKQNLLLEFALELLSIDKYQSVDNIERLIPQCFQNWLNLLKSQQYTLNLERRLLEIYKHFRNLLELKIVKSSVSLQAKLDDMTLKSIESNGFKELIRVVPKFDTKEEVQVHFQSHLKKLFLGKHSKYSPKEIIHEICGLDHLRINSHFTANILKDIIDLLGFTEEKDQWEIFQEAVKHSTFWVEIFSASGTDYIIHALHSHIPCSKVKGAIQHYRSLLNASKISYKQVMEIKTKEKDVFDLLNCDKITPAKYQNFRVFEKFKGCYETFETYIENMKNIQEVFQAINDRVSPNSKQPVVLETLEFLNTLKKRIEEEDILACDIQDGNESTQVIKDIAVHCNTVKRPIKSKVFMDLINEEIRQFNSSNGENITSTDDAFDGLSISTLFGEECKSDVLMSFEMSAAVSFISDVGSASLDKYRQIWMPYVKEEDLPLENVIRVFGKIKTPEEMKKEIEIAEEFCSCVLKTSHTLLKFADRASYKKTVEALQTSTKLFPVKDNPETYAKVVQSFYHLFKKKTDDPNKSKEMTFKDMENVLNKVEDIRKFITSDVTDVLKVLNSSTSLLTFLEEVIDEDIRNLIDAVEEHSEQFVRESTVSDLIEVKRFFFPILKRTYGDEFSGLFSLLNKQLTSGFVNIPAKITDCMDNLHTLKALYKNVANRGERTKEIIDCIVDRGKFSFHLKDYSCTVYVKYKQEKKTVSHKKADLSDLRSRAFLLMNAEDREKIRPKNKRKKEDLEKFLRLADATFEIENLCCKLSQTGHFDFIQYDITLDQKELVAHGQKLKHQYEEWVQNVSHCRREYYYLNFVFPAQLQQLYGYLHKQMSNEREVLTCLQFIDSDFCDLAMLKNYYQALPEACSNSDILNNIAQALQKVFSDYSPKEMPFNLQKRLAKMTDEVQPGRPYIAALDSGSHLVIRTMFALFLNTTNSIPQANQILLCRCETSIEEIELILRRCIDLPVQKHQKILYCLANVELLQHSVQVSLVDLIHNMPQGEFLLAIICCGQSHHPFLEQFSEHLNHPTPMSETLLKESFRSQWPDVYVVSSDIPGTGKTELLHKKAKEMKLGIKTLHISGKIDNETIIENLHAMSIKSYHLLHIDVGTTTFTQAVDNLLFQLIVLRHLSTGSKAYTLSTRHIYVEIANTVGQTLCNSLPTTTCFKRINIEWKNFSDIDVSNEINSPVQVVCHYLRVQDLGSLDTTDLYFTGANKLKPMTREECVLILQKWFAATGEMSYTLLYTFLNVLADQLKKLSSSVFFRTSSIAAMIGDKSLPTVKSKLCKAMVDASKEFACRSVQSCKSLQESNIMTGQKESFNQLTSSEELAKRIQGMIRWEDSNHLMILFHQNVQTVSALYRKKEKVLVEIKNLFESQMQRHLEDYGKKPQKELQEILQLITRSKPNKLTDEDLKQIASGYALTPDNLLKMVLISLRVNANIPVVIMGETGCGKTSLVRYLAEICDVNMTIMSIHAGIEEAHITEQVMQLSRQATDKLDSSYWLFLDEINTCDHLGIINSVICHRFINGHYLPPNVTVIAACNPYRLRSHSTILTAGLQGKVKTDELSRLVYRVHPLPESLIDFVWDYGSLDENDEKLYISRMINDIVNGSNATILTELLAMSQRVVRAKEDTDSCVSLRDVDRCRQLVTWFNSYLKKKKTKQTFNCSIEMKSIILALAVSYHSRFSDPQTREEYRKRVAEIISRHQLAMTPKDILKIIRDEQNELLERMDLPSGIAKNTALQENVFVVLVCILNRIPVFLVGKPGCSKSLSMQLIRSNLRGKDSKDDLFQQMPQLFCVSFQGSESSTSDGIIKVFEKAENYQKHNDQDVISVVILDEIGLAEVSRFNPLKVLHGLLEPAPRQNPNVAVVGISNWALDSAKMNRAVHLSRPDMDLEELKYTGYSIIKAFTSPDEDTETNDSNDEYNMTILESIFDQIAVAYFRYINERQKFENFHGLRDYYSLIKYLGCWKERLPRSPENANIILRGIARNFGGLPSEIDGIIAIFKESFPEISQQLIPTEELIMENLSDESCRHLMLITNGDSVISLLESDLNEKKRAYEVIFGSHFDEDLSDDYNYRLLSRIILCMEQGLVLILKGLESIYGSLYDMLNQNYTIVGHKKNCRIALGHYSNPMCHVHDSFKCIVLVEETKLDYSDPPFLNRFEKQQFRFSDTLKGNEFNGLVEEIESTFNDLCKVEGSSFTCQTEIPSFSRDLIVSLVLFINKLIGSESIVREQYLENSFNILLWTIPPEVVVRARESKLYQENPGLVHKMSDIYFELPLHNGLLQCLEYFCSDKSKHDTLDENDKSQMILCYTYTNVHFNLKTCVPNDKYHVERLSSFKSEKQLGTTINDFFASDQEVFLMQCSACYDGHHLLLTKFIIENVRRKATNSNKYICMIVHLDRNVEHAEQFVPINFLSGWKLLFLDSLEKPRTPIQHFLKCTKFEIVQERKPLTQYIIDQLFWALTRIKFTSKNNEIDDQKFLMDKMRKNDILLSTLEIMIMKWIEDQSMELNDQWGVDVAKSAHELYRSGSLVSAFENRINDVIKYPIAMYLYNMLELQLLSPVFVDGKTSEGRIGVWKETVLSEKYTQINKLPPITGPECYSCSTPFKSLRMPLSCVFMNKINMQKDEFIEIIRKLRIYNDIDDEEEVPTDLLVQTIEQCVDIICHDVHDILSIEYDGWMDDYYHDFCNVTSMSYFTSENESRTTRIFKWAFQQFAQSIDLDSANALKNISMIHASLWLSGSAILSLCQLVELSEPLLPMILSNESDQEIKDGDQFVLQPMNIEKMNRTELVECICKQLLGTRLLFESMSMFEWISITNKVIPMAKQVVIETKYMPALQLMTELITLIVKKDVINLGQLHDIGDILIQNEGQIHIQSSFDLIECFLSTCQKDTTTSADAQRVFCSYVLRCLHTQPDEIDILKSALSMAPQGKHIDENWSYFGKCVTLAIMVDTMEDESVIFDIIGNEMDEMPPFIACLDDFLKTEDPNGKSKLALANLIIDVIEMSCLASALSSEALQETESTSDDVIKYLMAAFDVVMNNTPISFRYVAAVALIKRFLFLVHDNIDKILECQIVVNHVNTIIADNWESNGTNPFMVYFLKLIASKNGLLGLRRYCQNNDTWASFGQIPWKDEYYKALLSMHPLLLYIDPEVQNTYVGQINNVLEKGNTVDELFGSDDLDIIVLLDVIASNFCMRKCIKELNDAESRIASEVNKRIQGSKINGRVKQISKYLLGEEFELQLFNLSESTKTPTPEIVSLILHLCCLVAIKAKDSSQWLVALLKPKQEDIATNLCLASTNTETVSVMILKFLKGCITIGSIGFNFVPNMPFSDQTEKHSVAVYAIFNELAHSLIMNYRDTCDFLHHVIDKCQVHITEGSSSNVMLNLIDQIIPNRWEIIVEKRSQLSSVYKFDNKCIEAQIDEIPFSDESSFKLFSLLRMTLKPTKENFELELQHCKGEKYAFLSFVFKHKKQLSLLKHLPVLLRWYVTVVESASYKFRKVDFKDLTIQKFFSRETDDSKRGILKKHFELFRKSWTEIKEDYKSILDEKILESMESVTTLSEMKSCTILHDGAILATIFRELVGLNNSFLNKMAQMSDDNQEGVSQQPVKLLELRANNVLTFSLDDDWLKFSQCNTMLGLGQNIFFDFDKIQEEVTKNVLHGKCRIECPDTFPKPVFTDDLYQNSVQLLLDVQSCILQQNITNEIRKSVQQKTDRDASFVTELLSYIGMVMSLIKKTGGDGSQPLIEYMEKWQSITSITSTLCKRILPEPTDSVKLCHVVALYQFLEEMNGMSLVDTLDNSYRTSLPTDAADVLRKAKKELMVYVDKMVHPLLVFVHRYLALKNNDIEMDHTLVDYLNSSDLWWNGDFSDGCIYGATVKDKIPLKDVISPLILIEHVFETITFVQDAVKESKEYNARISTISMDYKKQTSSKPTRSRTARKFMKM